MATVRSKLIIRDLVIVCDAIGHFRIRMDSLVLGSWKISIFYKTVTHCKTCYKYIYMLLSLSLYILYLYTQFLCTIFMYISWVKFYRMYVVYLYLLIVKKSHIVSHYLVRELRRAFFVSRVKNIEYLFLY